MSHKKCESIRAGKYIIHHKVFAATAVELQKISASDSRMSQNCGGPIHCAEIADLLLIVEDALDHYEG